MGEEEFPFFFSHGREVGHKSRNKRKDTQKQALDKVAERRPEAMMRHIGSEPDCLGLIPALPLELFICKASLFPTVKEGKRFVILENHLDLMHP